MEQYSGGTDERSDIYALGATLYYLLTREIPPNSVALLTGEEELQRPRTFNPEISLGLQEVLLKMLALKRDERYATIGQTRDALRGVKLPRAGLEPREFRICALCRHLRCQEQGDDYEFACKKLGWVTQEKHIAATVQQHLQLESGKPEECPYWEPA